MKLEIKPMETPEEIEGKAYVHWKGWHEAYTGLVDPNFLAGHTLEKCTKTAYRWPSGLLVAKDAGRVIGFAGYGKYRDKSMPETGELYALYILSEYYGTGAGRALLDAALERLAEYPRVALWVLKGNARAIRFYEKCGFGFDGTEQTIRLGQENTELRMLLGQKAAKEQAPICTPLSSGGDQMSKFAVLLYPNFSLQEITCLTSALTVWFGEMIEYIASEDKEYRSEEGLRVLPDKTTAEAKITDYDCVILPGTIDPMPALFDEKLIDFLRGGAGTEVLFAAISSSPLLLSKAGILRGKRFTAGYFMQMAEVFPFIEKEKHTHEGVVEDGNVITGIGMFFREFAEKVLRRLGYETGSHFMRDEPGEYTKDDLTFYWTEEEYQEFLQELAGYPLQGGESI